MCVISIFKYPQVSTWIEVIIGLMQIGGLGLMTLIAVFVIFLSGKLTLSNRLALNEAVNFFNLNDFNLVVAQRDKKTKEVEKFKKRNGILGALLIILGALLIASIIISADLATQVHRTERALEIAEQRIEVLEVQANDLYKAAEKTTEKGSEQ